MSWCIFQSVEHSLVVRVEDLVLRLAVLVGQLLHHLLQLLLVIRLHNIHQDIEDNIDFYFYRSGTKVLFEENCRENKGKLPKHFQREYVPYKQANTEETSTSEAASTSSILRSFEAPTLLSLGQKQKLGRGTEQN